MRPGRASRTTRHCWRHWPWTGASPAAFCARWRGPTGATRPPVTCCGWPAASSLSCSGKRRSPDRCGRPQTSPGRPAAAMPSSSACWTRRSALPGSGNGGRPSRRPLDRSRAWRGMAAPGAAGGRRPADGRWGGEAAVAAAAGVARRPLVTVCTRPRRHARRFAAAGATVVDLAGLADCLAASDVAILATTAPHPLVDARMLRSARDASAGPLTLVDLSMPRNVDPAVRALPWVRLIDLAGLRFDGMSEAGGLARDLAATEEIIETELQRYRRWLAGRSAAAALHRMRGGAEDIAREELARIAGGLPPEIRSSMERVVLRTVHRLVHK